MPTLQEFSNYYEEFDDAVKSLGDTFMPAKKVVKEIFIAKITPQNFQDVIKNECSSDPLHFQNYNTVFVKAYSLLLDAKNASATIGWYNQSRASVASKTQEVTIHNKNPAKRKSSEEHSDSNKLAKMTNPQVSKVADKSQQEKP
jgi:hypothetical protein